MYIEVYKNNGLDYLRLSENYRPEGSLRPKRRIILNIGALSNVTDGQPDFVERLRESFRNGTPLLSALEPYVDKDPEPDEVKTVFLSFPVSGSGPDGVFVEKWFADLILNGYMEELGLSQLFRAIKSKRRFEYDLLGFVKLVVFGRILDPASKRETIIQNGRYFVPLLKEGYNPDNVYDMLDVVYENRLLIFRTVDAALRKRIGGRDTSMVFYDVSNFFFEIELNDEDILDGDGVVIEEGLRKRGHSKENRPQPIVQMGMFMDKSAVPIGIKVFPGNTVDKATLISSIQEIIAPLEYDRFIYCADRGLCTRANLGYLVLEGMGYLLSKSIKQSPKEEREWILEQEGYIEDKDENGVVVFKYKHTIISRKFTREDGTEAEYKEKVVVFWSREYYQRECHMMEKFSNFLTDLENKTKSFTLNASQIKSIKRFLKDEVLEGLNPENDSPAEVEKAAENEKTGDAKELPETEKAEATTVNPDSNILNDPVGSKEASQNPKRRKLTQEEKDQKAAEKKAEAARLKALKEARTKRLTEQLKDSGTARSMIDWDKVNRWRDYAGYYQIVTSELEMDDVEIINQYRLLTMIENRFRTMKGTLDTRPFYVRTPEHIQAHLILCTISLIIMALMQGKLKGLKDQPEGSKWFLGMDPDRIQDALNAFLVEAFPEDYLRFRSRSADRAGQDLQEILDAYSIHLESRLYKRGELRSMRGVIEVL